MRGGSPPRDRRTRAASPVRAGVFAHAVARELML